jgi:hypothetical protein
MLLSMLFFFLGRLGLLNLAPSMMFLWFMSIFTAHSYPATILPQQNGAKKKEGGSELGVTLKLGGGTTYAGHPNMIARLARTVFPFPYPSLSYIAGANRGNPKPASDRRHEVAASAVKI